MSFMSCAIPMCFVNTAGTQVIPEQDAYDYAAYVVSTGKDYDSGQVTKDSAKVRREFMEQFPEYATLTFWKLQFIGETEKQLITDWFFQDYERKKIS